MAKWDMDLCYGISVSVTGIEADTREQAIEKAKELIDSTTTILTDESVDAGDLEYDQCSFIQHGIDP